MKDQKLHHDRGGLTLIPKRSFWTSTRSVQQVSAGDTSRKRNDCPDAITALFNTVTAIAGTHIDRTPGTEEQNSQRPANTQQIYGIAVI
jgi:hypothetical protein